MSQSVHTPNVLSLRKELGANVLGLVLGCLALTFFLGMKWAIGYFVVLLPLSILGVFATRRRERIRTVERRRTLARIRKHGFSFDGPAWVHTERSTLQMWGIVFAFSFIVFFVWMAGWEHLILPTMPFVIVFLVLAILETRKRDDILVTGEEVMLEKRNRTISMAWDDISEIALPVGESTMTFYSHDGRKLKIAGPAYWRGRYEDYVYALIEQCAEERSIPITRSSWLDSKKRETRART